jgi:miniconductance mechanosensitive channel
MLENIIEKSDLLKEWLQEVMINMGLPEWTFETIDFSVRSLVLFLMCWIFYFIVKRILLYYIIRIIKKSKSTKDDYLVNRKVFHRLAHLAPAQVIYFVGGYIYDIYPKFESFIMAAAIVYMIAVLFWSIQALIRALEDMYNTLPYAPEQPIRGYMQLISLLSYFVGFLIIISYLFGVEVTRIFAGMGAMAAVLLLIFKDTILGFVAGIQLSANKMLRVGDWIEMPSHNADGDVLEITLNTVKVQNWDRTITTIPTYALVSSPFMNWRGMVESGGRRIKRSINIDMHSVKFCTPEMIERFKKVHHLRDYIESRQAEIDAYNQEHNVDASVVINGRRMTNFGVFRKYLENYIRRHPKLNMEMIFLVRHLQPSEKGIPIEIYVFSKEQSWVKYEEVQADIFDHILAVIPEFDLKVFQLPSGDDLKSIGMAFAERQS